MPKRNIIFTMLIASLFFLLGQFSIKESDDLKHIKDSIIYLSKYSFLLGCQLGSRLSEDNKSHQEACSILMSAYSMELEGILNDF